MDRRERFEDPVGALIAALTGWQAQLWTAIPGIVQSFDAAAMTVSVQPAIQGVRRNQDGSTSLLTPPLLLDCPVVFPGGGGYTLTFPINQGDEALVIFASRCIDAWWQSSGVQAQVEMRMHDLSDGFAIIGPRSRPRALSGVSTSSVQLRADDGGTFIELASGVINILGNLNVQGNITATGNVTGGQDTDPVVLNTHTHSGVDAGSDSSGPPN